MQYKEKQYYHKANKEGYTRVPKYAAKKIDLRKIAAALAPKKPLWGLSSSTGAFT